MGDIEPRVRDKKNSLFTKKLADARGRTKPEYICINLDTSKKHAVTAVFKPRTVYEFQLVYLDPKNPSHAKKHRETELKRIECPPGFPLYSQDKETGNLKERASRAINKEKARKKAAPAKRALEKGQPPAPPPTKPQPVSPVTEIPPATKAEPAMAASPVAEPPPTKPEVAETVTGTYEEVEKTAHRWIDQHYERLKSLSGEEADERCRIIALSHLKLVESYILKDGHKDVSPFAKKLLDLLTVIRDKSKPFGRVQLDGFLAKKDALKKDIDKFTRYTKVYCREKMVEE